MARVCNAIALFALLFLLPPATGLESSLHPHGQHRRGDRSVHRHAIRHLRGKHVALLSLHGRQGRGSNDTSIAQGMNTTVVSEDGDSDADDETDSDDDTTEDKEEAELVAAEAKEAKAAADAAQKKAVDAKQRAADKARMSRAVREARRQKIFDAEEKLQQNLFEEQTIESRVIDLENTHDFHRRVDKNIRIVANETQTRALAELLGDMYKEMRKFGAPFLIDHLKERGNVLKVREGSLQAALADAKLRPDERKQRDAAVKVAKAEAPPPVEKDPSAAMFTEKTMPLVSPAVQCIMLLTLQFFLVYTIFTVLESARNYVKDERFDKYLDMAEAGKGTVAYAPMLAVLFAAVRVRAVQLSGGDTVGHSLPQPWVQATMYCCTCGVFLQLVLVMATALFGGSFIVEPTPDGGSKTVPDSKNLPMPLYVLRYFSLAMLYVGIAAVLLGVCTMPAPAETAHLPVSPAVRCTIMLTVLYFGVYLISAMLSTYLEFRAGSELVLKLQRSFDPAQSCVSFAPMVAILFIGARVRALQIDPANGNPQAWAQNSMFACTIAVFAQTVVTIALPHIDPQAHFKIDKYGQVEFVYSNRTLQVAAFVVWYIILFTLYIGIAVVIASVFLIQHPAGPAMTPSVAPAMHCTIELAFWYFLVQTALFVVCMIQSFFHPGKAVLDKLADIFDKGVEVLKFAPMLAVLFMAARIRANQLTIANDGSIPPKAGPQHWAQQMMFVVTWSVIIRALMQCLLETVAPSNPDLQTRKPAPKGLLVIMNVVSNSALVLMYAGSCAIVVAMFTMTPETLPPYKHSGLPGGVDVPEPVSPGAAIANTQKLFLQVVHQIF